jgi:hypothetical protein
VAHLDEPGPVSTSHGRDLARISPDLARISPDLARISPDLAGISPDLAGIWPVFFFEIPNSFFFQIFVIESRVSFGEGG